MVSMYSSARDANSGGSVLRGEERRLYRDGKALTELARRPQHLRLIRKRQSVAGFDLNRRHAFSQTAREARSCAIDQFFKTCLPRSPAWW